MKSPAWAYSRSEMYRNLYAEFDGFLNRGGRMAAKIGDHIYLIDAPEKIKLKQPDQIQLLTSSGWITLFDETLEELAASFNMLGPLSYDKDIELGMAENRPIPPQLVKNIKRDKKRKSPRIYLKTTQLTLTIDASSGIIMRGTAQKPKRNESVQVGVDDFSFISDILEYDPRHLQWVVRAGFGEYNIIRVIGNGREWWKAISARD